MSIAEIPGKGKLVVPDISECDTQQEMAWLYEEYGFPVHPWIRTRTKISARRGKGFFNSPEVIETYEDIALWARRWQAGFACSWRTGLIAIDVDDPSEFDDWDISHEVPDTVRVATGREGGYHLYLDCRHLRASVPLEEWPRQGDIPGGTLKTNGFVGAPGSRHPSGRLYRVTSLRREVARGSLELVRSLAEYRSARAPSALETSPGYVGDLLRRTLAAREGEQHEAVLMLLNALEREMSREAITGLALPFLVRALPAYDRADPWTLDGLQELLGSTQTVVTTAEEERLLADIATMTPHTAGEEGEDWFWNSREDLTTIRQWAQAQLISPWALLGEIIAEVIARVPPTFVLPDLVGGYGSLNMMIAITGSSSGGKGGAAAVLEQALDIDEPRPEPGAVDTGIIIDEMRPVRWGVGSGEGLVKLYAFNSLKTGQVRTSYTAIIAANEVGSLNAIVNRSAETLTSELNKFYMGEPLGFAYGDPGKKLRVDRYSYRGVLIVGVQPERSGLIVNDDGSGFSRRWLLMDAIDRFPPDVRPPKPQPIKWSLPRGLADLDHRAERPLEVAEVCPMAADEIIAAREEQYRNHGKGAERGHTLFTQEKLAEGFALLAMRTDLNELDWKLARYATERSEELRSMCLSALRKSARAKARVEGALEGIKDVAKEDMRGKESDRKFWQTILRHIPDKGKVSRGELGKKMPQRRTELKTALNDMVKAGILTVESGEYQGRPAEWYSKKSRG